MNCKEECPTVRVSWGGGQMTERGVGTRGNGSGQKAGKSGAKRPKRQERRARLFEQIMKLEESERTG